MRCQDQVCSMYRGACSTTCIILPSRSTQLLPTSWDRKMKREWEQLLPTPLHTACQSPKQVGRWDSSAFLPATEKQAGPLNFMEDWWRKGKRLRYNPEYEMKSIQDERCGTQSNHSYVLSGQKDCEEFVLSPHALSEPRERQRRFWHGLHYQWNCTAPPVACSQHIPERHNSASPRPAYEWITGKIICCSVLFGTPQVLKPCRSAWKESCSAALLCAAPPPLIPLWGKPCQRGIQPSQKPRGNTFKNTSRKHLDASYNLLPDYSFCLGSSALKGLSLPTLQKLGGKGEKYRESGKSVGQDGHINC